MRRFAVMAGVALASSAVASPPPPPPSFIDEIARRLLPTQTPATIDDYARLLADNLTVTIDGKTVADTKQQWLGMVRQRLGRVDRTVEAYAEGRDSILVFDDFDDKSDEHCPAGRTCIFDPRYHARAVKYQVGADHLIHDIRIVQTDGFLRTP